MQSIPTLIGGSVLTGLAAANQLTFITFVVSELVPRRYHLVVNSGLFDKNTATALLVFLLPAGVRRPARIRRASADAKQEKGHTSKWTVMVTCVVLIDIIVIDIGRKYPYVQYSSICACACVCL